MTDYNYDTDEEIERCNNAPLPIVYRALSFDRKSGYWGWDLIEDKYKYLQYPTEDQFGLDTDYNMTMAAEMEVDSRNMEIDEFIYNKDLEDDDAVEAAQQRQIDREWID